MGAAIVSSSAAPDLIRGALATCENGMYSSESLLRRFEQFYAETSEIIPRAGDALLRGDIAEFGALVALSQLGAENALGNQIPATISLVQTAHHLGAVAASAFGAGFGGSVWALVDSSSAESFRQQWAATYHEKFPEYTSRSDFFATRAGPAATQL
jgi:galactokinase